MALKAGRVGVHPNDVDMLGHIIGGGSGGSSYTFEEKEIGTWVDGRPVYQKVVVLNTTGLSVEINKELTVSNIEGLPTGVTKWIDAHILTYDMKAATTFNTFGGFITKRVDPNTNTLTLVNSAIGQYCFLPDETIVILTYLK